MEPPQHPQIDAQKYTAGTVNMEQLTLMKSKKYTWEATTLKQLIKQEYKVTKEQ